MMNLSNLPASEAERVDKASLKLDGVYFTFVEANDERVLFSLINEKLMGLETSLDINRDELVSIKQAAEGFRMALEEKEEVALRLEWLDRLYEVKDIIPMVTSKESAEKLLRKISSAQTSPMKNKLVAELDGLINSLPSEQREPLKQSQKDILMEKAIEEAGDAFINLGRTGRESVISEVFQQFGKKATIEAVQEHTENLEVRVKNLSVITGQTELIQQLNNLQMTSFSNLSIKRKEQIVERLLETGKWSGIAPLESFIVQLDRLFKNEEQQQLEAENTIITSDGEAAMTVHIKHVEDGKIQLS